MKTAKTKKPARPPEPRIPPPQTAWGTTFICSFCKHAGKTEPPWDIECVSGGQCGERYYEVAAEEVNIQFGRACNSEEFINSYSELP
jgi:hypothetical protein